MSKIISKTMSNEELIPPYNIDAEKAVLGSLLIDSDAFFEIQNLIKKDDFFDEQHKVIFGVCDYLINNGSAINQITVAHELARIEKLEEIGGASYLSRLIVEVPTSLHIEYYSKIVKETSICRKAIIIGQKVMRLGYSQVNSIDLVKQAEEQFLNLQKEVSLPKLISPDDLAEFGVDRYTKLDKGISPAVITGFYQLDQATGGMFGGESWILGGRPGLGKTSLLLDIAYNVASMTTKKPVLVVSLEQGKSELLDRRISQLVGKSPRIIRSGRHSEYWTDELFVDIISKLEDIKTSNIYLYDASNTISNEELTIRSIASIARHLKLSQGLCLIVIDYLGMIEDEYGKNQNERISYISRKIKRLAVSLDVPSLTASQLSRALELHADKRPNLSDLRDSGSIEQDADVVMFLYRDDYYRDKKQESCQREADFKLDCISCREKCSIMGEAELIIPKRRMAGGTEISIPLKWDFIRRCYYDPKTPKKTPEEFR